MALKRKISKEQHAALNDVLKAEYKPSGDHFVLDTEGDEGFAALKQEKQEAIDKANRVSAELAELRSKHEDMLRGNIPKADVDALENSWKTKLQTREAELTAELNKLNGVVQNLTVDSTATSLASSISTAPGLLIPHIKSRLKVELVDGQAVTRVLDQAGKPTAMTVDELANEFKTNTAFAPVIIGSKASGGGAGGSGGGGAAKKLSEMTEKEVVDLYKTNPEAYRALKANESQT